MLRCFFGCDKIDMVVKGKFFDEFITNLMVDVTKVTYSPLILLFGMFPYNHGLTKEMREARESVAILRGIST